jgi:hypothetical protein
MCDALLVLCNAIVVLCDAVVLLRSAVCCCENGCTSDFGVELGVTWQDFPRVTVVGGGAGGVRVRGKVKWVQGVEEGEELA